MKRTDGQSPCLVQALAAGRDALRQQRDDDAARWFDRAWRLAPGDPAIGVMLASALVQHDRARARGLLEQVRAAHPGLPDAALGLAAILFRDGDDRAASDLLATTLRRGQMPRTDGFRRFADAVADAAGAPGWTGVDAQGRMTVAVASCHAAITIDLDGQPVRVVPRGRRVTHRLPANWREARRIRVTADGRDLLGSPIAPRGLHRIEGVARPDPDGGISGCAWVVDDPHAVPRLTAIVGDTRLPVQTRPSRRTRLPGAPPFARRFRIPPRLLAGAGSVRILDAAGRDLAGSPVEGWGLCPQTPTRASGPGPAIFGRQGGGIPALPWRDAWNAPSLSSKIGGPGPQAPAGSRGSAPGLLSGVGMDVIIAVHGGAGDLAACLAGVRRGLPEDARIIIVDDASEDAALAAYLAGPAIGDAVVLRQARNRGFPAAVNAGLRHGMAHADRPRDVILLNPDTLLPQHWIERLARAAYAAPDIGSVTPMSNDGTIVSCVLDTAADGALDQAQVDRLDRFFAVDGADGLVDLPTGVGFCLFLRHDCLADTGLFREDIFAQGYGEENDWCLRARARGWRHVAQTGLFVAHAGGRSFGARRALLMARNSAILARLHPRYAADVRAFLRADPLRAHRRRIAAAFWADGRCAQGAVILVTHAAGGGTERCVAERAEQIRAQGLRPIVIRLSQATPRRNAVLCTMASDTHAQSADLRFELPREADALCALLHGDRPVSMEVHHLAGLAPHILELPRRLRIPHDIVVHDYAWVCPRVTFLGAGGQYCGEPADVAECERCVAACGSRLHETITVADLRARSGRILRDARQVIVSCDDVSRRLRRYFPHVSPIVAPWEERPGALPLDPARASCPGPAIVGRQGGGIPALPRRDAWNAPSLPSKIGGLGPQAPAGLGCEADRGGSAPGLSSPATLVCVVGALGQDKGYDVVWHCAEDAAARALALRFVVVGHTVDDARLMRTGRCFVTGRFREAEACDLVRAQHAHLGFVASVCPETWSFALSTLWRAGLPVVGFALGAPAERIGRSGAGWVMPLGAPPARVNDFLLDCSTRVAEVAA